MRANSRIHEFTFTLTYFVRDSTDSIFSLFESFKNNSLLRSLVRSLVRLFVRSFGAKKVTTPTFDDGRTTNDDGSKRRLRCRRRRRRRRRRSWLPLIHASWKRRCDCSSCLQHGRALALESASGAATRRISLVGRTRHDMVGEPRRRFQKPSVV